MGSQRMTYLEGGLEPGAGKRTKTRKRGEVKEPGTKMTKDTSGSLRGEGLKTYAKNESRTGQKGTMGQRWAAGNGGGVFEMLTAALPEGTREKMSCGKPRHPANRHRGTAPKGQKSALIRGGGGSPEIGPDLALRGGQAAKPLREGVGGGCTGVATQGLDFKCLEGPSENAPT